MIVNCKYKNILEEARKLGHRNNKKDKLHLSKHEMHLIRLFVTGTEMFNDRIL